MNRVDIRDIIGGIAVIAIGLLAAAQSIQYDIGDLRHMGPGYFPLIMSLIITVLGVGILAPAFFRAGDKIEFEMKDLAVVVVASVVFALTIRSLGIFVAVTITMIIACLVGKNSFVGSIVFGAVFSVLAYLVFVLGLGMTIPVFPWSY